MANKYDISVIIPVYNVVNYLEQTINSILSQKKDNIEVILIDDGSNDGSEKICDNYANLSNFKIIHKENEGQGIARNIGMGLAKGKYIYFLDSDDFIDAETLLILFNLSEEKKLDIVCFAANIFYEENNYTNTFTSKDDLGFKNTSFLGNVHGGLETFVYLKKNNEYLTSAPRRFFNREFLKKNNLLFPERIIHEDEVFGFKSMVMAERVTCIPNRMYNRRVRSNSTMTGKSCIQSAKGYLYSWENINEYIKNTTWGTSEKNIAYKFCGNFLLTTFNMYCNTKGQERMELDKILDSYLTEIKSNLYEYGILIKLFVRLKMIYILMYRVYKRIKIKRG